MFAFASVRDDHEPSELDGDRFRELLSKPVVEFLLLLMQRRRLEFCGADFEGVREPQKWFLMALLFTNRPFERTVEFYPPELCDFARTRHGDDYLPISKRSSEQTFDFMFAISIAFTLQAITTAFPPWTIITPFLIRVHSCDPNGLIAH